MHLLKHICPGVMDYVSPWIDNSPNGMVTLKDTAGVVEPYMARQHFLFHTTIDVLCFCHLYPHLLSRHGNNVFTALGLQPNAEQIQELKKRFPNARIVGVFDDDLCGRTLDCKVTLWQKQKDVSFSLMDGKVSFEYRGNSFDIPEAKFSLHSVRTVTGIRSSYRTIKPKGFVSFASMLAQSLNDR